MLSPPSEFPSETAIIKGNSGMIAIPRSYASSTCRPLLPPELGDGSPFLGDVVICDKSEIYEADQFIELQKGREKPPLGA